MARGTPHDETAKRIGEKYGIGYNRGKGPDLPGKNKVIEVETPQTISEAGSQLRGYKKPVYVAPTTQEGVKKAIGRYKDTTIGVMGPNGNIIKPSTRKKS